MDFTNRNTQPSTSAAASPVSTSTHSAAGRGDKTNKSKTAKWLQMSAIALLFSTTILAIAVIGMLAFGNRGQFKFVNSKKYQAVFLTNGQVYFGNIKEMGEDYFHLQNIYYLQTTTSNSSNSSSSSSSNNSYTLVQLGCQQIHDPYNEMIINRSQVSFWENLQDNGQVVQKINQFKKQYPNGPDCSQVSSQTQASTDSSTQPSSSTTGSNSSSSNSTTKKP